MSELRDEPDFVHTQRFEPMTLSLEEHVARLTEALKPFAELAQGIPDAAHDAAPAVRIGQDAKFPGTFTTISNGQFRRARAAIAAVRERDGDAAESKPSCQRDDHPDDACIWPKCVISCPGRHFPLRAAPDHAEAMRVKTIYDHRKAVHDAAECRAGDLYCALKNLLDAVEERPGLSKSIESVVLSDARGVIDGIIDEIAALKDNGERK